jgi:hypothetical protein
MRQGATRAGAVQKQIFVERVETVKQSKERRKNLILRRSGFKPD